MKHFKLLFLLLIITVGSLNFCSCSSDDDNSSSEEKTSSLVGTWVSYRETATNIETGESNTYSYVGLSYVFYQDGTGVEIHDDYSINIKWYASGSKLMTDDDGYIDSYTYSLNGSTLWMEFEEEGYLYRTYYSKD